MSHISIGSILPVGTIIHSMLTTTQFATQYGDNWVLADGRSATGTLYASVTGISAIPDLRGGFLRAKGATLNPDGDLALGTLSSDKVRSHTHKEQYHFGSGGDSIGVTSGCSNGALYSANTPYTLSYGGNETAPVSITVNIFIRIN
jgi:hypothetical protein